MDAKFSLVSTLLWYYDLVCDRVPKFMFVYSLLPRVHTEEIEVIMPTVVGRARDDTVIKTADRM